MNSVSALGKERIVSLDIIRGFALFGIFLVNMPSFSGSEFMTYTGIDKTIRLLFDLFVQTKFYTIFSFLFGLGFYIFMTRAEARGANVNWLFSKRLLALLLFGVLHILFFWHGDILHSYAIAGFLLLLFYRRKAKTILIWAFVLLLSFQFLIGVSALFAQISESFTDVNLNEEIVQETMAEGIEKKHAFQTMSYVQLMNWRISNEVPLLLGNLPLILPDILGTFLLGLFAGKIDLFRRVSTLKKQLKRTQLITLLLSIPSLAMIIYLYSQHESVTFMFSAQNYFFVSFSGMVLSIFYIVTIILLLESELWQELLQPLRYAGQMALTNYLCQTIICFILFFGFGLYGKITLWQGLIVTIIIFPIQIIFSYIWLRRFQFGPFEWIWRTITYGKVQKLSKIHPSD
ncbi:DUF418 domain-containing protein [Cytobacillus sp. Hm23]